jgi:hypothetical protein
MDAVTPMTRFSAAIMQAFSIALLLASPWWYAGADWKIQQWMFGAGILLAAGMAIHATIALVCREKLIPPAVLVWVLLLLGAFAMVQAQPRFAWQPSGTFSPPTIQIQRWALGMAPPPTAISDALIRARSSAGESSSVPPCCLQAVPEGERMLALSIEPATTRAAAGSLFLASLMVWIGSLFFSGRKTYPILLAVYTILGLAIGVFGILNVISPASREWLELDQSSSFATFVSKNSAGAFLNIAFAASLGLVIWGIQRAQHHLQTQRGRGRRRGGGRYAHDPQPWQTLLAGLDSVQIASMIALMLIGTALLQTLSRGAVVSGMAAGLVATLVAVRGKQSAAILITVLLVASFALGFMIFFQLDERVVTRLESFGDLDIEMETRGGRFYIWNVSWQASRFYSWLGSGLGTFHLASLPFQSPSSPAWYYHAESIYLESLVTLGYVGWMAIAIAIASCFRSLRGIYVSERFRDFVPIQVAGFYLLVSQTIHSAVDFALILPGVYIPAALLMGAALGATFESHRVIRKWKGGSDSGLVRETSDVAAQRSWAWTGVAILLSAAIMLALRDGRNASLPLAVAAEIEQEFQERDQLAIHQRGEDRLNEIVERAAENRIGLQHSPHWYRLIGDSLCFDLRMRQWKSRNPSSDPKQAWNETAPFLTRLAYERTDDTNRDDWIRSIGGESRLDSIRKASRFFARARALSPLDWRPLWGNLYTSLDCSPVESARFLSVLQRTSSHRPQLLTSGSIFFNEILTEEERLALWRIAMRSSPDASIAIGRIMTIQYADGTAPLDILPANAYYLYKLVREVFVRSEFPESHRILCQRGIGALASLSKAEPYRVALATADFAKEAEDIGLEIQSLKKYLLRKMDDERNLARLLSLEIRQGKDEDAKETRNRLKQLNPNHPALRELSERRERNGPSR